MEKYLGIELGSTRIKAVLIDGSCAMLASGSHEWENKLEDSVWTYDLDDAVAGLQDAYRRLAEDYKNKFGEVLARLDGVGISGMMHGYLVFDENDNQLVPFRTWRNTITERAAAEITERFRFNIPQRWSAAHLYQAILNNEPHIGRIAHMTTLAGYIHWKLTGRKVIGVGDASGMFPIDSDTNNYDAGMLDIFNSLVGFKLENILPQVLNAGDNAGELTDQGAKLLDPEGALFAGAPFCPPEGDAGTGMVATNSITERTGNVSAGTSVFAMIVLEKPLSAVYTEVDMVTTPDGKPVAMVHCNSCTSDLDAWFGLLGESAAVMGAEFDKSALYTALFKKALEGDADGGGLLSYNYYSGEPITGLDGGRPLFLRNPDSALSLANFIRTLLYSTMATLKIGMDILTDKENVKLEKLLGHGGLFKTTDAGQRVMAAALNVPAAVMESAGEGGAWGIALLAAYAVKGANESLDVFLNRVFANQASSLVCPDPRDAAGFAEYMKRYKACLPVERAAVENLR